jgi:hypothetical protein
LMIVVAAGCTTLPMAHAYSGGTTGYIRDDYDTAVVENADAGPLGLEGRLFCRDLERSARGVAVEQSKTGWVVGIGAILAIGAGTVLAATSPENSSQGRNALNASLPLVGGVLGYISFGAFNRSDQASSIAATAASAMDLDDATANKACNGALAAWNSSRPDASKAIGDAIRSGPVPKPGDTPPRNPE